MTTPGSSIWQSFDPSAGSLPDSLSPPGEQDGSGGGVVAVIASEETAGTEWAPRVALEIARQWARGGARVMMADLGLEHPSLHRLAGVENGEGMSDVFRFGASIQRIACPVDDGSFFLAPAGTVTADPAGIMEHSRWEALEEGFGSAAAVLALYVPAGDASVTGVLDRADRVILLGEEDTDPSEVLGGARERLVAALSPAGDVERAEEEARGAEEGVGEAPAAASAPAEESRYEEPGGTVTEQGVGDEPVVEPEGMVEAPLETAVEVDSRRRSTLWIVIAAVLLLVAGATAVWLGYVEIPGLDLSGSGGP